MPGWLGLIVPPSGRLDFVTVLSCWWERRLQRVALAKLDKHLLADIGVSEADRAREVRKPFWVQ
ncbi:DUF1127 domain-containing protein [Hwanghaeella grinnelliae]|uniref:DUF1127 domain-containing protein n=1 Tax=Hwanghaeella grinnelliae TaxID=2500179 RepID=A0A437QI66_9PROT|nr:DUF1127 domain-containing protein [Hwanghaeella grinnelliae]RVU34258.1 DUF1127 domain-containing protein [Hwanghaeella grinnelliae]